MAQSTSATDASAAAIRAAIKSLLTESFDGVPKGEGSCYIDPVEDGSILGQLAKLSAADASRPPRAGGKTIASHANHAKYHAAVIARYIRGVREKADWPGSFNPATVDDAQWNQLQQDMRTAYENLKKTADTFEFNEDNVATMIGAIAHAAYHLGAIKQIVKDIRKS